MTIMTKVLHINDYPIETGGGAEVVMRFTIALLRSHGLMVETFTSADLAEAGRTPLRYVHNAHARAALATKLEAYRPDVVHLHNYYHILSPGILAALEDHKKCRPLRVVMTAHDYHLVCPNSGGTWFRWWTGRREAIDARAGSLGYQLTRNWDHRGCLHSLLRLAQHAWNYRWRHRQRVIDLVICPSQFVREMLSPLGLPTCWLPHPVAPPVRGPAPRAASLRFVFAGRIEPEKGLNEFLQLWPADFPATFTIIGDGAELERCMETCKSRNLADRVEFTGRMSHTDTLQRIAGCHVLVQPSRVPETYGLTLIEALSSGTNVLAVNRGAAREIVEATVGFLYEPDDAASLAAQLQAIRESHEAGTLNRFDIADFLRERSEDRYIEQLLQLYDHSDAKSLAA